MNLGSFGFGSGAGTPSGMISGGGSVPKIPKFTAASVIGDSQMSDNGTTVVIGAISKGTPSALFEVNSTTQGVLFPRVTTAQRNAITVNAAANSLFVYNTTISQYQYYDHTTTSWKTVDNGLDGIYSGSGIVPAGTTATITDYIAFNGGEFRTENGYWQGTSKILYINPNGTIANLFVGESSGNNTMTGTDNTGLGLNTLLANTSGNYNVSIGSFSLSSNTTGHRNTAIGYYALYLNTTGGENVGIGMYALNSNTTGSNNVSIGSSALGSNTTGIDNVAIGRLALSQNTTSNYNVAIGNYSGQNTTGTQNTFIGTYCATTNTTGSYNVAFGYNSFYSNTSGSNNTAIGSNSLALNTTGEENIGIGRNALSSNTTGSTNVIVGYQSFYTNTVGSSNVALGAYAGYYETGSNKLFIDNAQRANEADGRAKALIYGIFDAATTNQYLNINANTNTPLTHYNYMAASNSADTVGDVRFYATYVATVSSFIIEKCTVANAAKGGGTWVLINSFGL